MSRARPETEQEWKDLEFSLSRCNPLMRAELFLILDPDIRRQLIEREQAHRDSASVTETGSNDG